jgi:hypothetical protein
MRSSSIVCTQPPTCRATGLTAHQAIGQLSYATKTKTPTWLGGQPTSANLPATSLKLDTYLLEAKEASFWYAWVWYPIGSGYHTKTIQDRSRRIHGLESSKVVTQVQKMSLDLDSGLGSMRCLRVARAESSTEKY